MMVENYTLTLNKAGMDAVIQALSELPYRTARPVIDEALRQFIAQEAAAAGVPQPGEKPAEPAQPPEAPAVD